MIQELELNNQDTIIKLCNEVKILIPSIKKKGWHKKFICNENNKYIHPHKITFKNLNILLKEVAIIMEKHNFDINYDELKDTIIEFHYANTKSKNQIEYPIFSIHNDDHNEILVNTLICYLDVQCEDGELAFYDKDDMITKKISTKSFTPNFTKIAIFSGNLKHNAMPIKNGHRYAISFQIPR